MEDAMCNYCGCIEFPLVKQLIEEHEAIEDAAGRLRSLVEQGRVQEARQQLNVLVDLLASHVAIEEGGLFAELRKDGMLAAEVEQLCVQHTDMHEALGAVTGPFPDWEAVLAAVDVLRQHILDEEYDLFPAAAMSLPISTWDRITPALQTG
jgi:hemerythrin-like domain-containing protein